MVEARVTEAHPKEAREARTTEARTRDARKDGSGSHRVTGKGTVSRQAIVKSARDLVLRRGYHGTSVRAIARACRKTVGGLYAHYRGKERIFVAVLEQYHPFLQVVPALQAASGSTVEERIRDGARRMVAALGRQREALNLIFIEIVEFQGAHFATLLPRYFPKVQAAMARMRQARGSMRDLPLDAVSRSYFGLVFSFFLSSVALGGKMPGDDRVLDTFIDIYLHGILSRADGAGRPVSPRASVPRKGRS